MVVFAIAVWEAWGAWEKESGGSDIGVWGNAESDQSNCMRLEDAVGELISTSACANEYELLNVFEHYHSQVKMTMHAVEFDSLNYRYMLQRLSFKRTPH